MAPGETLAAGLEAGEIAAAGGATVGRRADAEKKDGPGLGAIILLAPGGQFLAVTARAARELPCAIGPNTGFPTIPAPAAAQRINPHQPLHQFREGLPVREPDFPGAALWTVKLHSPSNARTSLGPGFIIGRNGGFFQRISRDLASGKR